MCDSEKMCRKSVVGFVVVGEGTGVLTQCRRSIRKDIVGHEETS